MGQGARSLIMTAGIAVLLASAPRSAQLTTTSSGRFVLELDGLVVGVVSLADGGLPVGEVIKEPGDEFFVRKRLGVRGLRDIRLEFGSGMAPAVYEWIQGTLQGQLSARSGAILSIDTDGIVRGRLDFLRAQITEITFPAVDGRLHEAIRFGLRLVPQFTSLNRESGRASVPRTVLGNVMNRLTSDSFRLTVDGVDTSRALRVETLVVRLPLLRPDDQTTKPQVDIPDVIVTTSGGHAESFFKWFDEFVIQGVNDDPAERAGALEYLARDGKTVLFRLTFGNLGIFDIALEGREATRQAGGGEVMAAMYCESLAFDYLTD